MSLLVRWCYRIGLMCGALALVSALIVATTEFVMPLQSNWVGLAEQAFRVFGLAFMWLGLLLLVAAIVSLAKNWHRLSTSVKVVSVLGLGAGTFLGAYFFHWLFPSVLYDERRVEES